jgi:serine/threonine protein kinase
VSLGVAQYDSTKVAAIKRIKFSKLQAPHIRRLMEREIEILREIKSDFVIKLFGRAVASNGDHLLLLELCNGGDLSSFLNLRGGTLKEAEALWFLKQIINAIIDYTKCNVVHRDLKLANLALLIEGETFETLEMRYEFLKKIDFKTDRHKLKVKVIDFGLACKVAEDGIARSYQLGSRFNRAPELLSLKEDEIMEFSSKADVWAVGVLFFEMLTGYPPFRAKTIK